MNKLIQRLGNKNLILNKDLDLRFTYWRNTEVILLWFWGIGIGIFIGIGIGINMVK